jgi:uncharacterized protein DUF4124
MFPFIYQFWRYDGEKQLSVIVALLICIFLPHAALAELYGWVDENGVKHFSNYPPPEGVKSFRHTLEIQSKATDADVRKNIRQQNQHSALTPSDKDVSGKSGQGDGTPQDDNVTSDNVASDVDWIRRVRISGMKNGSSMNVERSGAKKGQMRIWTEGKNTKKKNRSLEKR